MCRSCDQTPDGAGRRCPARVDGFTAHESDQRSRSRGLGAAYNALAAQDHAGAANALARAVAAQRELDGLDRNLPHEPMSSSAQPDTQPHRDVFVPPSALTKLRAEFDALNAARSREGKAPIVADPIVQRAVTDDPMLREERVRVRLSGESQDALDALRFAAQSEQTDRVVDTRSALAVAHAIARSTGGYRTKAEAGPQSTAAMLSMYLADAPDGKQRHAVAVEDADWAEADRTLAWASTVQPTSDYMRSVRDTLANKTVTHRGLALAVSAIPVAQRQHEREQRAQSAAARAARTSSRSHAGPTRNRPQRRNEWIGRIGQRAHTTGYVESITPTQMEKGGDYDYLLRLRTEGGALVKTFLPVPYGVQEGQRITLTGLIMEHEMYDGKKATVFEQCEVPVVHHQGAA